MEVEDDMFFADLNKQISLLIMDDDEDAEHTITHYPSFPLQAISRAIHPALQPSFYHHQACKIESKGTGVFIPRLLNPKRKKRQRVSSSNARLQRQPESSGVLPQAAHSNTPSHRPNTPRNAQSRRS
ncbi:hypothetical protein NMG60_11029869 [Bertholletia excelsa]